MSELLKNLRLSGPLKEEGWTAVFYKNHRIGILWNLFIDSDSYCFYANLKGDAMGFQECRGRSPRAILKQLGTPSLIRQPTTKRQRPATTGHKPKRKK